MTTFGPIEDYRKMTLDELDYEKARLVTAQHDLRRRELSDVIELRLQVINVLLRRWATVEAKEYAEEFIARCDRAIDFMLGKDNPPKANSRRRKRVIASSTDGDQ